jgi:hypothetical protein
VAPLHSRRNRRGNAAVVVTTLGTMLGFAAVAVDLSMVHLARVQLQVAVDSAALSGAQALDGTNAGIENAIVIVKDVGLKNRVLGTGLVVKSSDIEIGTYDAATRAFTVWSSGDASRVNAVRVEGHPVAIHSALGKIAFGIHSYSLEASAMGQRLWDTYPAASSNCYLPFAIPDCNLANTPVGSNPPPIKFNFTSNSTLAWAAPAANPSASWTKNHLLNQCSDTPLGVGATLQGSTGELASALSTSADILNNLTVIQPTTWDTASYGTQPARNPASSVFAARWSNVYEGPVAMIDAGTNCAAPNLSGTKTITGVAWGVLYDVTSTGNDKALYFQLDLKKRHDIWAKPDSTSRSRNVYAPGPPPLVY